MINFKHMLYLRLIFFISLFSLFFAYFTEYALGYQPCKLCLIERIPYGLSVILIFVNFVYKKNEKFFLILLILIFSFSSIVSFYHFGIELGLFEESAVCGLKNAAGTISKEEILKQLNEINVSCKDVTFKVFGLSLTTINVIVSLIITIILIKIYNSYEKNRS